MDEFKRILKYHKIDPWDGFSIPKKWGRRAAKRKLKSQVWDLWSEHLFWGNEQLWNTWDDEEDYF